MPPKCKFQEGEKVLCFHGPLIYEAKCLKSSINKDKQIKYFIHYAGWNKNWDEWVPESRVLKYNEANVQRQREVQRAHSNQQSAQKNKKGNTTTKTQGRRSDGGREKDTDSRASTPVATAEKSMSRFNKGMSSTATSSSSHDSASEPTRKKRSRLEPTGDTEEYLTKAEVKIKLPEELKYVLIDESEVILKHHKLPALPVQNTVDKILDDYVEIKSSGKTNDVRESALEVTKGIREYFNITLGLQLLYKWERPQFIQIMNDNPETLPSQLYGAFHLLRLFVRLGGMLSYAPLDERSIQLLLSHFHDFLQYLQKNNVELFNLQQDYTDSPPDYHRKYG
ncbi:mortality factor 4-like protein 1 [Ooceraea biroi]|uniref:Mortality factor 4-like protein n=2 Tax=Ooceraea biroi TaxID=2015173 RepID=A0A026X0Q7_OOCBI|nr:mortality factor 4-like protein 1 [Ooceraea biroi]EZA61890.1 Mortality factor 4-like protein [Ooceraea biroi]